MVRLVIDLLSPPLIAVFVLIVGVMLSALFIQRLRRPSGYLILGLAVAAAGLVSLQFYNKYFVTEEVIEADLLDVYVTEGLLTAGD